MTIKEAEQSAQSVLGFITICSLYLTFVTFDINSYGSISYNLIFKFMEKVYLSSKKVFLEKVPIPPCSGDDAEKILSYSLQQQLTVERSGGDEINLPSCQRVWCAIVRTMVTSDERWGIVFSVYRQGLVGLYFYRQNDDFMTEMVDPDDAAMVMVLETAD